MTAEGAEALAPAARSERGLVASADAPFSAQGIRRYLPGLTVTGLGTLAAVHLADQYGAPLTLMALLIGLSLNFLSTDERLAPGLTFSSGTLLRLCIVLVGLRVTLAQIAGLGPLTLIALIVIAACTIGTGIVAARWLRCGAGFGILAGGSVAICGASAAMALFATLGERHVNKAQLSLVLVGISALSPLAMVVYPIVAHELGLDAGQAGFLLGAAIHDVAQALGAGYSVSPEAGDTAAIVKLGRVILLAPLLLIVAVICRARSEGGVRPRLLPWFIAGFLLLVIANSLGFVPKEIARFGAASTTPLLACAVTATAIQSRLSGFHKSGVRPFLVLVAATVVAFVLSLLAVYVIL